MGGWGRGQLVERLKEWGERRGQEESSRCGQGDRCPASCPPPHTHKVGYFKIAVCFQGEGGAINGVGRLGTLGRGALAGGGGVQHPCGVTRQKQPPFMRMQPRSTAATKVNPCHFLNLARTADVEWAGQPGLGGSRSHSRKFFFQVESTATVSHLSVACTRV